MRLVALFCKGHYLFNDDILINFGGEYIYDFLYKDDEKVIEVKREKNSNYIENFFGENISLLSSIVGSNGSGKTSLINSILLNINNTSIGIIDCEVIVLIFENEDKIDIVFRNHVADNKEISVKIDAPFLIHKNLASISTIFYTPILDIRELYINFSVAHFADISKYRLFQDDTEDENGSFSQLAEFHLSENLKRWIQFIMNFGTFLESDFGEVSKFDKVNININRVFTLLTDFHDTSYDFRNFAKFFYKKWQDEYHGENPSNQKRLELNLILSVIEKTFNILERTGNRYLQEGKVNIEVKDIEDLGLKDSFYLFLDNHFFEKYEDVSLPVENIKAVIEVLINNLPSNEEIEYNRWEEYSVDFKTSFEIIDVYQSFIRSFSDDFMLDKTIMLTFKPNVDLSTGEKGLLDLFSSYYSVEKNDVMKNVLIFIDEGDTSFHPEWKKKYINSLVKYLPKIFDEKKIQIILTTHDAFTLSDIPVNNIIYLKKENDYKKVLKEDERPQKSFGANITDLLSDSFFINDGLLGDFAKEKIQLTLEWLKREAANKKIDAFVLDDKILLPEFATREQEITYHKNIIEIIDEPLVKGKLKSMYLEFVKDDEYFKNEEIERLREEIKKLESR